MKFLSFAVGFAKVADIVVPIQLPFATELVVKFCIAKVAGGQGIGRYPRAASRRVAVQAGCA